MQRKKKGGQKKKKEMQKKEWVYWTDRVAEDVKKRVAASAKLKNIVKERGYIVYDEKTPSGPMTILLPQIEPLIAVPI